MNEIFELVTSLAPAYTNLSLTVNEDKFELLPNASSPKVMRLSGPSNEDKLQLLNAWSPIVITELYKLIEVRLLQQWNALLSIYLTLDKLYVFKFVHHANA